MTESALRAFLDTNVFSYLVDWDQADPVPIRERLLRATKGGLVRVEGSLEVFSELAGTIHGGKSLFRNVSNLLFNVVGRWWMLPFKERHILEVTHPGRLPDNELYLSRDLRRKLKRFRDPKSEVRAIADDVREHAEKHKTEAERTRANVIACLKTKSVLDGAEEADDAAIRRGIWSWWKEPDVVAIWCRDMLDDGVVRGIVVPDEDRWPDPETSAPSLWNYMSYRLVRIALEVGEKSRIQPSDEYDARHYSAAATYADVLVTEDKRFRGACEMLGEGTVKVMGLLDFDTRVKGLLAEADGGDAG